ncbi:MAG: hypothetical protein ACR2LV_02635 [Solirubrobacteraceae bacterium]
MLLLLSSDGSSLCFSRGFVGLGTAAATAAPDAAMQTVMLGKHDGTPRASKDHGDERGGPALAATVAELHGRV